MRNVMRCLCSVVSAVLVAYALLAAGVSAQQESVRPGINKPFEDPDLQQYIERFEKESREIAAKRQDIVAACQLKPGMAVADIGAGTGLFTRLFATQVGPQGRVYAVDISAKFVEHIRKTCREAGLQNVTAVLGTPTSTELPPQCVDLAFICDTYHHFEFPHKTMASIHRALRPGGRLILIDFHRIAGQTPQWLMEHVRAGEDVFSKEIESAGFRKVDEANVLKENYFVRFEKLPGGPQP